MISLFRRWSVMKILVGILFLHSCSADGGHEKKTLTLYFPEPGEQVWEIAKRYSTAPAAILEENGLTDDGAAGEGMLLIPAVR